MALLALVRHSGRRRIPVMRGGPKMQHVHVEDVAGVVAAMLEAPPEKVVGRAFNVAADTPLGQGELFEAIMPGLDMEPLFHYPYFTRAYWPFIRGLLLLPDSSFSRMNGWFKKKWESVISAHSLEPALAPRLDRDFLSYMNGDYALDDSALKSIGYQLKHPDSRAGLANAVRWYQDHQWLPKF
jgi:nucleoside-diphosphate-sugar epimerase